MGGDIRATAILAVMAILGTCLPIDKAQPQDLVLLSGNVQSIKYDREIVPQGEDVIVGALFKVRLSDLKPLIGHPVSPSMEVELAMASMPARNVYRGRGLYVVLKTALNGRFQTLGWDYADSGLCIPKDVAKTYLIEDDLMRLRQAGAVNWKSDCKW